MAPPVLHPLWGPPAHDHTGAGPGGGLGRELRAEEVGAAELARPDPPEEIGLAGHKLANSVEIKKTEMYFFFPGHNGLLYGLLGSAFWHRSAWTLS